MGLEFFFDFFISLGLLVIFFFSIFWLTGLAPQGQIEDLLLPFYFPSKATLGIMGLNETIKRHL